MAPIRLLSLPCRGFRARRPACAHGQYLTLRSKRLARDSPPRYACRNGFCRRNRTTWLHCDSQCRFLIVMPALPVSCIRIWTIVLGQSSRIAMSKVRKAVLQLTRVAPSHADTVSWRESPPAAHSPDIRRWLDFFALSDQRHKLGGDALDRVNFQFRKRNLTHRKIVKKKAFRSGAPRFRVRWVRFLWILVRTWVQFYNLTLELLREFQKYHVKIYKILTLTLSF